MKVVQLAIFLILVGAVTVTSQNDVSSPWLDMDAAWVLTDVKANNSAQEDGLKRSLKSCKQRLKVLQTGAEIKITDIQECPSKNKKGGTDHYEKEAVYRMDGKGETNVHPYLGKITSVTTLNGATLVVNRVELKKDGKKKSWGTEEFSLHDNGKMLIQKRTRPFPAGLMTLIETFHWTREN